MKLTNSTFRNGILRTMTASAPVVLDHGPIIQKSVQTLHDKHSDVCSPVMETCESHK